MANTVVGIFKDGSTAQDAVSELLVSGFLHDQLNLFTPHLTEPGNEQTGESLNIELKKEAGIADFFRSLASMLTDYDEVTVYSSAVKQGSVVLTVYADNEERCERAVELMSHHSPLDIKEYYPREGSASPWGRGLDSAMMPETPAGNVRVHRHASSGQDRDKIVTHPRRP